MAVLNCTKEVLVGSLEGFLINLYSNELLRMVGVVSKEASCVVWWADHVSIPAVSRLKALLCKLNAEGLECSRNISGGFMKDAEALLFEDEAYFLKDLECSIENLECSIEELCIDDVEFSIGDMGWWMERVDRGGRDGLNEGWRWMEGPFRSTWMNQPVLPCMCVCIYI